MSESAQYLPFIRELDDGFRLVHENFIHLYMRLSHFREQIANAAVLVHPQHWK